MATAAVVVVVVVTVMVAVRRAWYQVVRRVEVAERKLDYFVRLNPAAVVKLKPLQMYYLHTETATVCNSLPSTICLPQTLINF